MIKPEQDLSTSYTAESWTDRRVGSPGPRKRFYTPGLRDVVGQALSDMEEHDRAKAKLDPKEYQVEFKLGLHCKDTKFHAVTTAEFLGLPPIDVTVTGISSLAHDVGKILPECWKYMLKRTLTPEEKAFLTERHPIHTGRYINRMKFQAEIEDSPILGDVFFPARFHHIPHQIENPRLRLIGVVVNFCDTLVSCQEKRHLIFTQQMGGPQQIMGMKIGEAREVIEVLPENRCKADPQFKICYPEMVRCRDVILQLIDDGIFGSYAIHNR